jgi:hypothetical protein
MLCPAPSNRQQRTWRPLTLTSQSPCSKDQWNIEIVATYGRSSRDYLLARTERTGRINAGCTRMFSRTPEHTADVVNKLLKCSGI